MKKPLTSEEIVELSNSPYVSQIVYDRISFTPEFKKIIYDGMTSGKTVRMVLKEYGIDPKILGAKRLESLASRLRRKPTFVDFPKKSLMTRVKELESAVASLQQEIEILKGIL